MTTAGVTGDRVTLTFSGDIRRGGSWTIVVNGRPVAPKAVAYARRGVQLVLPQAVYGDDTIRVVGRSLRSSRGLRLRLVDERPQNRSAAGCTQETGTITKGAASSGPTDTETFLTLGTVRILAVGVDYADAPAGATPFGGNPGPPQLAGLDRNIRELSYGRASLAVSTHPGIVRMPKNIVDYAFAGPWGARKAFFQDIVLRLDPELDFSKFDAVFVSTSARIPRGGPRYPTFVEPSIAAPIGSGVVADGRELRHFAMGTTVRALYSLAGLPPLGGGYVGGWDPMGEGSPPNAETLGTLAWNRRKLGWLRPQEVRCLRRGHVELTLEPLWRPGGVKMVVVPTAANRAIVLENRQRAGVDASHCKSGVLAYEVRTDWQYHLWLLGERLPTPSNCLNNWSAPFDFRTGDSTTLREGVRFEVLAVEPDGAYRLRVTR